jgi:magnesium transporter
MSLRARLASSYLTSHPLESASLLERRPAEEVIPVLALLGDAAAAHVLRCMSGGAAQRVLESLPTPDAARLLAELPLEVAATLLRRLHDEHRDRLLAASDPDTAEGLRAVISWPAHTAGAIMDPRAIALPEDLTAEAAQDAVKRDARHAIYNLYVVDREGRLIGVLNLRELLNAPPQERLGVVANAAHHSLPVNADHRHVLEHPGWLEVSSLPVVDAHGRFMGAVRYRALRRLEREHSASDGVTAEVTAGALGDLFRTGLVGVISAVSGGAAGPRAGRRPGPRSGEGDGHVRASDG